MHASPFGRPWLTAQSLRAREAEWELGTFATDKALKSLESGGPEESHFLEMGRKAARWMQDAHAELEKCKPDMGTPVNRAADNWKPLFRSRMLLKVMKGG
jgi:hypothetical protein